MELCKSCGEEIRKEDSFCSRCGTPTGRKREDFKPFPLEFTEQEDFRIKRCPSCGEGIPSFVAICPACGNEMRGAKVSSTLENFITQINEQERKINRKSGSIQTGFLGWPLFLKIFWILINIGLLCIPLAFYMILPMIRTRMKPSLTTEESELASLIENYPIPNERASVLETLVYAKEKIDFLSKEILDRKTAFWIRLWSQKAEQLKEKADLLFPNDKVVKQTYEEIQKDRKKVNRVLRAKALFGLFLAGLIVLFLVKMGSDTSEKIEEEKKLIFPQTELSRLIPKLEGVEGKVKVSSSEYLSVECKNFPLSEYEVYKRKCMERGFTIDSEEVAGGYEAYNKDGYKLKIYWYESELSISLREKIKMRTLKLPGSSLAKEIPPFHSDIGLIEYSTEKNLTFYVGNTSLQDYDDYVGLCLEQGFEYELSQYEKSFKGKNAKGYTLRVRHEGFETMYIDIEAPIEEK